MKRTHLIRILSTVMILALLLPAASASADVISSDGWITVYSEINNWNSRLTESAPPLTNYSANNLGGWYQVPLLNGGMGYVPATDVTVVSGSSATPTYPTTTTTGGTRPDTMERTIPAGTPVYDIKGIYGANGPNPTYIASATNFVFTKVDEEWYKFTYNGRTYFYPYTYLVNGYTGGSSSNTGGSSTTTNTSYWYTFQTNTQAYLSTSTGAGSMTIPTGANLLITKIDSSWYSLVYNNITLYVPAAYVGGSSSSSNSSNKDSHNDGDAYTVVLSSSAKAYSEMSISSSVVTTLQAGSSIKVTKKSSSWYSMDHGDKEVYLTATDVLGNKNATDGGQYRAGESFTRTLAVSAYAYSSMSTSSTLVTMFASGQSLGFKKEDETWCSTTYNGQTVYLTLKSIYATTEPDPGDNIKVDDSFTYTTKNSVNAYQSMNTSSYIMHQFPANKWLELTKKSATWYATQYNGTEVYLLNTELFGLTTTTTTTTNDPAPQYTIGQTYIYTLSKAVNGYSSKSTASTVSVSFAANTMLSLTKLDVNWYSTPTGSGIVYLYAYDLFGTTTTTTTTNTAGVITTSMLQVNTSSGALNMRKQAKSGTTIMARIPKGAQVANLGYERDGSGNLWYKTTYSGRTGYVSASYVIAVGASTTTTTTTNTSNINPSLDIGRYLYVDTVTVNVRTGPGGSYGTVGRLDRDALVIPLSYATGEDGLIWYEFQYNAATRAYIRSDYLRGSLSATAALSGSVAIKSGGTNLRSGAGDSFGLITRLERDTIVYILSNTTDSSGTMWYNISTGGLTGFVRYDMVRQLTTSEGGIAGTTTTTIYYSELKYGSKGEDVRTLQQALINKGYLAAGGADGAFGPKTRTAVRNFQSANGLSVTGVADSATQAKLYGTSTTSTGTGTSAAGSGTTQYLDWVNVGYALINANKNITVYDIGTGVTWGARYVEGKNHADVVPASAADATKLATYNITGSYVRRPVIVTIAGQKYAGSMYAVGHGSTNFVTYFNGVMCIHFTGSSTHTSNNVDTEHQQAIINAYTSGY